MLGWRIFQRVGFVFRFPIAFWNNRLRRLHSANALPGDGANFFCCAEWSGFLCHSAHQNRSHFAGKVVERHHFVD